MGGKTMTDTQAFASMYERIGGAVTIDHLVESFYRRMDALPEVQIVRAKHAADLDSTMRVLKHYLTEWMGRPKLIRPRKATRLRPRHFGFPIGSAERDAWLTCCAELCRRRSWTTRRAPILTWRAFKARRPDAQPGQQSP